ncbi:Fe-S cluster biogenesis protein NfuA, 4Fe-4S-binding domain [Propionibacterium cyclohexanicum]|uniref:Fe-S cluster biogenesis protein NfuA, 4Fe-4S-binding domain n=1 Tax=Propionibacterium cyclohexanicum TaxID=64702 RepID=A0A1H9T0W0_9ACTN|nr:NifU family protein [Propionibacterium cyclohexanicum]SER90263.1 Fe-S cluster biogenesis protein NfuA, 4Fe-4S-binding domain [Propionibacterium cyclohexanicum]
MSAPHSAVISVHPERTANPDTLRWVVCHIPMPFAGPLQTAPGLGELIGTVVSRARVNADSIDITLAPGHDWRADGAAVRHGLVVALARTDEWVGGADASRLGPDDVLRLCACELIDGPVGAIATVHGGSIELVDVSDGVVTVRMHGACRGCPAAAITMHQRLESQLRRKVPSLREVVSTAA